MDEISDKKSRKRNFSATEVEILTEEVGSNSDVLFSSFSSCITNNRKKKIWEDILTKINANNTEVRTVPQLKKKWPDLRAAAKKKEVTRRKESVRTGGGGPPTQLTTVEQKIVSLIPPCQIEGIAGGFDSGVDGSFLDYALEADPDMSTAAMATSSLTCDFNDTVTCNTTEAMCITPAGTGTSIMMEDITARKAQGPDPVADAIKQLIAVRSQILLAENRRVEIEEEKLQLLREFVHVSPLNGQNVSPIIKFF
ncbi:nuclear apoptosis-inducing factor 1-like isoform X2 [Haliotis rufescens]|uniref:nuclear apoptosis-inducing factor 1-like isoform X2 n=1 Tax=Haliotis rufescens TaxID=6454 RepID=UPI00201ED5A5|nr:nuclear apoptosis-inducing factor 1-like isoform X2 [Haliotis rufescens]